MKLNEIYKCNVCGNISELIHVGGGELVCCGAPMEKLVEKSGEEGAEKHKPVIEAAIIKVGATPHPMEAEHHIEWIEVLEGDDVCRKNLAVGGKPEVEFCGNDIKTVRAYCNVHGLWTNK